MTWRRCNRDHPCAVCGRRDWCGYTDDGAYRCMRVADPPDGMRLVRSDANGGNTFRMVGDNRNVRPVTVEHPKPRPRIPWNLLCDQWVMDGWQHIGDLAKELGVTTHALSRMRVGWSSMHKSWTWPMYDERGRIIGCRLRRPDGSKWAVKGSIQGLFVPDGLDDDLMFVVEGASDTAAMIGVGLNAIGKPSAIGCDGMLQTMLSGRDVVVVADDDKIGYLGAARTADVLRHVSSRVRLMYMFAQNKDVREWINEGASAADIIRAANNSPEA